MSNCKDKCISVAATGTIATLALLLIGGVGFGLMAALQYFSGTIDVEESILNACDIPGGTDPNTYTPQQSQCVTWEFCKPPLITGGVFMGASALISLGIFCCSRRGNCGNNIGTELQRLTV